jgi:hypothetical protein
MPINHAWFIDHAKNKFLRPFRTLALKPFAEKNPVIESDWSPINWESDGSV